MIKTKLIDKAVRHYFIH